MRAASRAPLLSNRQSSTRVADAENSAKLTPSPSQVAPSGCGSPSRMRRSAIATIVFPCGWVSRHNRTLRVNSTATRQDPSDHDAAGTQVHQAPANAVVRSFRSAEDRGPADGQRGGALRHDTPADA